MAQHSSGAVSNDSFKGRDDLSTLWNTRFIFFVKNMMQRIFTLSKEKEVLVTFEFLKFCEL